MLDQYVQTKKIFMNFTVKEKKNIISCEIVRDVMDEMRSERKILMVIRDDKVDEYINLNMTEIDCLEAENQADLDEATKLACKDKIDFREALAYKVSITKLHYFYRVMRVVFNEKATISDPSGYKDKIKALVRADRANM